MNNNFIITDIERVIYIDKNEYPQKKLQFPGNLYHNELIYHFNGKSTIRFNGKILNIEENSIRFLPKCESTEYIVEKKECGECIDIFFNTNIPISADAFVIKLSDNSNMVSLFKKLFSVWVSKTDGYYFECVSLLYKIFAQLQKQNYIPLNQYNMIKPAIEYIEKNFLAHKISIPYLANLCQISEDYLQKLFIKKFGIPPIKYIIQLKINHASDLLLSEQFSVTQVAELCGYDNVYYFSRQFKDHIGVTPTVFIQRYQSSK